MSLAERLRGVLPCPDCNETGLARPPCAESWTSGPSCGEAQLDAKPAHDPDCNHCGGWGYQVLPCDCGRVPWALRRAMVRDAFYRADLDGALAGPAPAVLLRCNLPARVLSYWTA